MSGELETAKQVTAELVKALAVCLAKMAVDSHLVSSQRFLESKWFHGDHVVIAVRVMRVRDCQPVEDVS